MSPLLFRQGFSITARNDVRVDVTPNVTDRMSMIEPRNDPVIPFSSETKLNRIRGTQNVPRTISQSNLYLSSRSRLINFKNGRRTRRRHRRSSTSNGRARRTSNFRREGSQTVARSVEGTFGFRRLTNVLFCTTVRYVEVDTLIVFDFEK